MTCNLCGKNTDLPISCYFKQEAIVDADDELGLQITTYCESCIVIEVLKQKK